MDRPRCRRCGQPLVLMPSFDEPNAWELSCGWMPGTQDDAAFQNAWDNLPGDWVVRLERQVEAEAKPK